MNTFKTAVVLTTLLGVGYGVHVVLNRPLSHDNGMLQSNGGAPSSDEFGLPQLDIQPPGQALVEKTQSAMQNVQGSITGSNGMLNQAQNAVGAYASQATNAAGQVVDQTQRFANQSADVANNASSMANQFASGADSQATAGLAAAQGATADLSLNPADFPELPSLTEPGSSDLANQPAQRQPDALTPPYGAAPQQTATTQYDATYAAANPYSSAPSGSAVSATYGNGGAIAATDQQLPYVASPHPETALANLAPPSHNGLPPGVSGSSPAIADAAFANMWKSAMDKQANGMPVDALFTLSLWYANPDLSSVQRDSLIPTLDELAGQVIFSREHLFGPPHTVQSGETLAQIAAQYAITPEFIARVNGLDNPAVLTPGQQLKVVTGPFRAELSRSRREITLFVGSYYAGRFSAGVGRDLPLGDMALEVAEKSGARPYIDRDGNRQTVAGDPSNPYGSYWIGLRIPGTAVNPRIGLHSTGRRVDASDTRGCVSLSDRDADDLQAILSIGSRFTIHR